MDYDNRDLQKINLEMAEVFVEFCKKHQLLAYLCGGGCIGTIRHQGFIPWDDDLDFFMPREDYERFLLLWNKEVYSKRYQLSVSGSERLDRNLFATIRDRQTTFVKPYQRDLDIPHGVPLDIIPLDGYAPTKRKRVGQCIYAFIYSLFCAQVLPENHGGIFRMGARFLLWIFWGKKIRYQIWMYAKRKMTRYPISQSDFITELCSGPYYMRKKYKAEWFKDCVYMPFEGTKMPIPIGSDGYLKEAFGNYMKLPPEDKRTPHHEVQFIDLHEGYEFYRGKEWMIQ